jgi:hypothetical protein
MEKCRNSYSVGVRCESPDFQKRDDCDLFMYLFVTYLMTLLASRCRDSAADIATPRPALQKGLRGGRYASVTNSAICEPTA